MRYFAILFSGVQLAFGSADNQLGLKSFMQAQDQLITAMNQLDKSDSKRAHENFDLASDEDYEKTTVVAPIIRRPESPKDVVDRMMAELEELKLKGIKLGNLIQKQHEDYEKRTVVAPIIRKPATPVDPKREALQSAQANFAEARDELGKARTGLNNLRAQRGSPRVDEEAQLKEGIETLEEIERIKAKLDEPRDMGLEAHVEKPGVLRTITRLF